MKKSLFLLLLLLPCVAFAQGVPFGSSASPITNGLGQPIAGVTISVCTAAATIPPTCGTPVTIYQDAALHVPYTTLTTDGFGDFYFFIAPASSAYCYTTVAPPVTGTVCQPFSIPVAAGSSPTFGAVILTEGTAPSGLAGFDILYGDSSLHRPRFINNNGAAASVALLSDSLGSFTGTLTSAQLAALITDETGSGPAVFANGSVIAPTSVTTGQINQPAATTATWKDNQNGIRASIPSNGTGQGTLNNWNLTGGSSISGTAVGGTSGTGNVIFDTSPAINRETINTGISQGSGLKHQRFGATCTTSAVADTACNTTETWATPFPDTSYTVTCGGVGNVGNTAALFVQGFTASTVTVATVTYTATAVSFSAVHCIAIHD